MKAKKLNEKESLELITRMINSTKDRLRIGDGNIMLLWGYLTVATTLLVWLLIATTGHPAYNFLFFLSWIIGGIISPHIQKKQETGAKTYIDYLSIGLWKIIGYLAVISTFICLGFLIIGGKNSWSIMSVFALAGIGFAVAVQGLIIKEKSLIAGGIIGLFSGIITNSAIASGMILDAHWFSPMFICTFIAMLIIPGHLLNHKARKSCSKN